MTATEGNPRPTENVPRWASSVIDPGGPEYLANLRSQATVGMIATPRHALCCRPAGRVGHIATDEALRDFDQIPLTRGRKERIEGMYIRGQGAVPLTAGMFMSVDAPLLAFVESADSQGFRLLLDGGEVAGLVTLSDLQKLPVYSLLFGVLIAVEWLLMHRIRQACEESADSWLKYLPAKERSDLEVFWNSARKHNVAIDRLSCASLGQEIRIASKLGIVSAGDRQHSMLIRLKKLRDQVCHASDIATSPALALDLPARVREALEIAEWLRTPSAP